MDIKPFKDLNVTTMTLIARFDGKIHLSPIFCLLPITRIELPEKKRNTKKIKIPHCKVPGSILSLRFAGSTRGIFRTASRRHFRNSITMDISTKAKNISLKLSESSIQMCGPTSMAMGQEAIQYLFEHIHNIQDCLDYLQEHPKETNETVFWLLNATRGPQKKRVNLEIRQHENVTLAVTETHEDYEVCVPNDKELQRAVDEKGINKKIAEFLIQLCPEFMYHSQLCEDFQHILELERVVDEKLRCSKIYKAMVNYNYHLNFKVDRQHLKNVFDNTADGWTARYDPRLDHTVTIQIPYEVPEELQFMRKPDKIHCHTFMVQKSGVVTQSGPDENMMRDAYYSFMDIIEDNKLYIENDDDILRETDSRSSLSTLKSSVAPKYAISHQMNICV